MKIRNYPLVSMIAILSIGNITLLYAGSTTNYKFPEDKKIELEKRYVEKRRSDIKKLFEHKSIITLPGKDKEFCEMFLKDFTIQSEKISLVAPIYFTHDHRDSKLYAPFIDACPSINKYLISVDSELSKNQNYILYNIDIDNNPLNGNEWLFLEEGFKSFVYDKGGEAVSIINRLKIVDIKDKCKISGLASLGSGNAMGLSADYMLINPESCMHGIIAYQGKYYIYDINDINKMNILTIMQFDNSKSFKFKSICFFRKQ